MAPILSYILALGALASTAVASPTYPSAEPVKYQNNTLYTFQHQGCTGSAFVFRDFQPNTCAVSITRAGLNISQAIADKLTLVKSGRLVRNEIGYTDPTFAAWNEGPGSNADGPLQCGTVRDSEVVKGNTLCLSTPDNVNDHGYSYYRDNSTDDSHDVQKTDAPPCTGQHHIDGVFIAGAIYTIVDIPEEIALELLIMVLDGRTTVRAELDIYIVG
ncbi:hypothetical protein COCC4DRAFT_151910 [Bipolaris maydis ATCC 48331]|uniref:Ecp2 effector protein domain-containing protein n=2 Tax=Cochliobolus heterostrophus TaxID=5016 RepID=M2UJK1_COCH5|nr:uncharacterized protein COCC4DRAFT_151910 [Bipolaris maydis ATCC 48331]EMD93826.1 hypothetical protein COCHEDRAFT_1154395 [Bipolaris maydis C5]KAJ5028097.1 hypothetical protein J3E73DRAFT_256011 [Bipolaris maydis]ENH99878.1 hypothetical protein COCC4DRAFT_151910 [Bipolaris maydis ATCC 48331]KAJ5062873.1 hypothetical protein J3E74DRAFT_288548 [Bipolaris maydis]KAJ6203600.1 hypothetical protein PSV09DRAFT_1154395 [Bipolaris maydis]